MAKRGASAGVSECVFRSSKCVRLVVRENELGKFIFA